MYTYKADGELCSLVGLVCLVAKHGQACAFEAYMFIIHRQTQARMVNGECWMIWYDISIFLCISLYKWGWRKKKQENVSCIIFRIYYYELLHNISLHFIVYDIVEMIDYVHLNPIFFWIMNTHTNTHLVSFFLLKCFHFSTCTCVCYYCCQPMRMDGLHASTSITLQMQASVYIRVFHLIHHPHGYIWMCDAKRSVSERHSILLGIPSGVGWGRCLRVQHVRLWRTLDMSEFARDTEFFRWLSAFFLPSALTIWSLSTALLFVCLASVHVERSQLASRSQFPLVKRKRYKYVNNMTTSSASCVWPISKMAEISFTQLMAENVGSLRPAQNSKEMYILLYVRKVHFVHCVYLVFMFLYYFLLIFVFIPAAAVARCIRDHSHTHTLEMAIRNGEPVQRCMNIVCFATFCILFALLLQRKRSKAISLAYKAGVRALY